MKEELKIKDVMVGDWVDVRNNAAPNTPHLERITPSHFLRDEHWYGVELVPEILEKNGATYNENRYNVDGLIIVHQDDEFLIGSLGCGLFGEEFEHFTTIKFVHQLQHALGLCGIEKEIKL